MIDVELSDRLLSDRRFLCIILNRARGCHSLECVTCLRHIQRLTAIIQSSLEDSSLCIGIHVTKPCLHILNNVIIIMLS